MAATKKASLTPRQREIYEFLKDKILNRGYGPTVREIGTQFGIRSPNGVMCHLKALEKKGLIIREQHMSRAIQLSEKPHRKTSVTVVGSVTNGSPALDAKPRDYIDFAELFDSSEQFSLRVNDSSLSPHNISAGDHLIGRPQQSYRDGDLVVALVDGNPVLKRYYRELTGIRFEAYTGRGSAKPVDPASVNVMGVVVGVVRKI